MDTSILAQSNIFGETEQPVIVQYKGYRKHLPEGMAYCTKCKKLKPRSEFWKNPKVHHGVRQRCIECQKANYAENEAKTQKVRMRARNLRVKFSLTTDEYQAMFDAQGGVCAICGKPETKILHGSIAQLSVDHDHEDGRIRGLLCSACNLGLGYFRDKIESLSNAIDYLMETHR